MPLLLQIVLTTKSMSAAPRGTYPVNYPGLTQMVDEGDTIFLGRYLVTGADESSLFLEVRDIHQMCILTHVRLQATGRALKRHGVAWPFSGIPPPLEPLQAF